MIRYHALRPQGASVCFIQHGNLMFGPLSTDGNPIFEVIELRSLFDSLKEKPGLFGENHVNHSELHASLYYDVMHNRFTGGKTLDTFSMKQPDGTFYSGTFTLNESLFNTKHIIESGIKKRISPSLIMTVDMTGLKTPDGGMQLRKPLVTQARFVGAVNVEFAKVEESYYHASGTFTTSLPYGSLEARIALFDQVVGAELVERTTSSSVQLRFLYMRNKLMPPDTMPSPRSVMISVQDLPGQKYQFPEDIKNFGDLASDAIATLDSNSVNMFEFLQGLKNPKQLIPQLKNLSQLKTHAGNHLGVQYGILPTIEDLGTLVEAILAKAAPYFDSNNYQVLTAGASAARGTSIGSVSVVNRLKIAINPADPYLYGISEKLRDIGGFPSLNNLYELIPYSFVIDWFINIGDTLEDIDTRSRLAQLPVMYATQSSKIVIYPRYPTTLTDKGVHGTISIILYDRSVSRDAPRPTLNFEVSNELPNHWLEAGSLIVVARK